ncbi:MAG: hypothetical protein K0R50_2032 [Eubacterium sp.]|nr:hypothetical protein [Eubacterium sp.]
MNKTKKIIGLGLGMAVLVTSMGLAFAADTQSSASDTSKPRSQKVEMFRGKGEGQKSQVLTNLVTAGTITADQQKALQEAMKPANGTKKTIKEALDSLVTAGTITQVQEDTIIKAYEDEKAKLEAERQKKLEELAAQKGITVDELKAQMEKERENRGAGVNGDFKGRGGNKHQSVLAALVTGGTITADQQKAVQEAMKPANGTKKTIKEALDSLVTAGTITQAQEDTIIKAYEDEKAKLEAERQKKLEELAAQKGITVDELKAQMENGRKGKGHNFDGKADTDTSK